MGKERTATRARTKSRRRRRRPQPALVAPPVESLLPAESAAPGARSFPEGKATVSLRADGPPPGAAPLDPAGHTLVRHGPRAGVSTCPFTVRATTPSDAAAVAALWQELSRLHSAMGREWAVAEGAAERYARGVAAAAGNPRLIYLVAEVEIEGAWRVAGFIHAAVKLRSSLFRDSVVGEIPAVCVAPDACGRGVGSALVAAAMDWFRKRGISQVETLVAHSNVSARAFWRSIGFRESAVVLWAEVPPGAAT